MTLDGFRHYIKAEMEKGIPFIAYWYDGGMGLLRTGPIEQPPLIRWALYKHNRKTPILYDSEDACQRANQQSWREGVPAHYERVEIPQKPIQAKPGTIKAFRREMARLERERPELVRVEADGVMFTATGGFEL